MESKNELPRELDLMDATMINIGTIIGSAIFLVPSTIVHLVPSSGLAVLVWAAAGIVSIFGALSMAELSSAMPKAGGQYHYLRAAYGPVWGFLYSWTAFTVINTASIAAIAVAAATFFGYFIVLDPAEIKYIAILIIVSLTAINAFGLKAGVWFQNIFTISKMAALAVLVLLSFTGGSADNLYPLYDTLSGKWGAFGLALIAALWAYDGWIEITYVAGEVKNPQRNLPLSIILSTLAVIGFYIAVNVAYLYVLSVPGVSQSALVGSDTAVKLIGPVGATAITAAIIVSMIGANNGIVFTSARIPYALAREKLFFQAMAGVHPKFKTPVTALIIQGLWACALTMSGTFDQLITYVVFTSFLFYALSCGAVFILRRTQPSMERPYKTWGYPFTPAIFIIFALWLTFNTIREAPGDAAIGTAIILSGIPFYLFWKSRENKP